LNSHCIDAGAAPEALLNADQNVLETPFHEFELVISNDHCSSRRISPPPRRCGQVYKDVWGNNADAISLLYSGTGALKTDFTRTGALARRGCGGALTRA
jgi:hypothetical protein